VLTPKEIKSNVKTIQNEIKAYDECNEEHLEECVNQAITGVENMEEREGYFRFVLGIAEMKGEWTIRYQKTESRTEKEFASMFISCLSEALYGSTTDNIDE